MKRVLLLLMIFMTGCSAQDAGMDAAMELRSRCLGAASVSFEADICADYIETVERFSLECRFDGSGTMEFAVEEPQNIAGISGTVAGTEGTVGFDETSLAFPLMAQGRLSPLSAPWVLMKAIREGAVISTVREEESWHLTIDDSYADHPLTVDIWLEEGAVTAAEIAWEGRRCVTMDVDEFTVGA